MSDIPAQEEFNRFPPSALFLETTAQILRFQGTPEIQGDIKRVIDATKKNAGRIGTSAHVKREFDYVINEFFREVQERIGLLPDQAKDQPCNRLWREVEGLMPIFFIGGYSLLQNLSAIIYTLYGGRLVRPIFLQNVVDGLKEIAVRSFVGEILDDKSTCEVWKLPGGSCSLCGTEPSERCRLKDTCVINRTNFLASTTTLAQAGCAESKWLKNNLETLRKLEGKALHEFLGKHPGHLGDSIIFWEVPDGWSILSRDIAFQTLRDEHRKEIEFLMVRIPRKESGNSCKIRPQGSDDEVDGVLDNYNSRGARVHAPEIRLRARQRIALEAQELGSRGGEVTKFRERSLAEEAREKARPTFGLKFRKPKPKP
jgi:hypothetical protein